MKIACDTQISKNIVASLKDEGFDVVYRAQHEPDDVWFDAALDLGATVFISPDLDIGLMVDRMEDGIYKWVDVPQRMTGNRLMKYLRSRLKAIRV